MPEPRAQPDFIPDSGSLAIEAGPNTDLFIDPRGTSRVLNAQRVLGTVTGDFQLRARVSVQFKALFDAGVLLVFADDQTWAKLCFEYSPRGEPMVVSVVTREVSDDCNSFVVDGPHVWLRVARVGRAFVFHASTDGQYWQLIRHFALPVRSDIEVGFVAQSPTGEGCTATFNEIEFSAEPPRDLRSGE